MVKPTTVELDVSSGRPNPSWTLTPEEETELDRRLRGVVPAERPIEPPGLGYRGFVLEDAEREVRVYGGTLVVIEKKRGGAARPYADSNGLEVWLLGLADEHGHGGLVPRP